MPEAGETNIEVAHKLCEKNDKGRGRSNRSEFIIEILEAIILALVAVATAWSGYQAAQWDGQQAELYAEANMLSVEAEGLYTIVGEERIYDANTLEAWINAKLEGQERLAEFYERRFRDEYKPAFEAWLNTDPINNTDAPPGPGFMPEYKSANLEEAMNLSSEASAKLIQGTKARAIADDYVRNTVFLATVLVLMAISQRFEIKSVRNGLIVLSFGLLSFGIIRLFLLPRC